MKNKDYKIQIELLKKGKHINKREVIIFNKEIDSKIIIGFVCNFSDITKYFGKRDLHLSTIQYTKTAERKNHNIK